MKKNVTVYSKDGCYYCVMAKKYLDKHEIDYNVVNVSKSPEAMVEMVTATGEKGVPQLKIGDKWIVGFNARQIWKSLEK